jgi:hypothetical protein
MQGTARFVRWQAIYREHFSYAVNLFLTYSVAAFGYGLNLIRDNSFAPLVGLSRCLFWLSLCLLWVSIVLGIWCVLNRLADFRGTAQRALGSGSAPEKDNLDKIGTLSRWVFYCQSASFGLGVTTLGIVMLRAYGARLF